jgi:hypothetical protein
VSIAAYVLNRCPTKQLDKVPEEVWKGRKQYVKHLRVFGSLCYKHVPEVRRKKLGDRSEPMIFVGYHETGAYRLYNPIKHTITLSREYVIVCGSKAWDWSKKEYCTTSTVPLVIDEEQVEQDEAVTEPQCTETSQVVRTSQRQRFVSTRLANHEVIPDNEVNEGDFLHFALLADAEPLSYKKALDEMMWKAAMIEESYRCKMGFQVEVKTKWRDS